MCVVVLGGESHTEFNCLLMVSALKKVPGVLPLSRVHPYCGPCSPSQGGEKGLSINTGGSAGWEPGRGFRELQIV